MINLKFGRKISRTSYYRIVRNPLFAGTIKVKNFPVTKGIHEPIVSEEQFRICQKILNGNLKTITPIQKNNPEFPLRNFVGCAKCGRNITGGYSQGRSKKYPYYRCLTSGCHVNVGKKFLEDLFYDQLKLLQPDRRVLKLFEVVVRNIWVQHNKTQSKFQTLLRKQIVELEKKKRRIEELVIDRVFDIATYKIKSQEIEKGLFGDDDQIKFTLSLLSILSDIWQNADQIDTRQRIQQLIFPEGLEFDGTGYRTAVTLPLFRYLQPSFVGGVSGDAEGGT